mgnify:CR=1 FL=1
MKAPHLQLNSFNLIVFDDDNAAMSATEIDLNPSKEVNGACIDVDERALVKGIRLHYFDYKKLLVIN